MSCRHVVFVLEYQHVEPGEHGRELFGRVYAARAPSKVMARGRPPDGVQKIGRDHGDALADVGMLPRPPVKLAVRMTRPGGDDLTADALEFNSGVVV